MSRRSTVVGCLAVLMLVGLATAALADNRSVTIAVAAGNVTFTGDTEYKVADILKVNCPASSACSSLTVKQGLNVVAGVITTDAWTSSALGAAGDIVIDWSGTQKPLSLSAGAGGGGGAPSDSFVDCPATLEAGAILVDTDGNVITNQLQKFSEEDKLTVWVKGPASGFNGLTVTRKSAFRDVTILRILGDANAVIGGPKQGLNDPAQCKRFELADFSAGRGVIAVSNAASKSATEIEFAVRARYQGMFTVAFVASWLKQPTFALREQDGEQHIAQNPVNAVQGRYALMYTAFLPLNTWRGGNNPNLNQLVGLSVGVVLDDPKKNVLLGATVGPINGLSLVLGVHIGSVQQLAGVAVNDVLAADAKIPTDTKWSAGFYLGVGLDVSVATKLFFSLFSK